MVILHCNSFIKVLVSGCILFVLGCSEDPQKPEEIDSSSSNLSNGASSGAPLSSGIVNTSSSSNVGSSSSTGVGTSSSSIVPNDSTVTWVGQSSLLITEVNPINYIWLDETGSDPGWVEIYNAGSETANLNGYSLVENLVEPRKWVFGDEVIGPKQFRTVFCDNLDLRVAKEGTDTDTTHFRTHTNWKLEKDGGSIYLIDYNWNIRDSVKYPVLEPGVSWGRVDGGSWKYFAKPTPEKKNTESDPYSGVTNPVTFGDRQAGFYSEPITLNPPTSTDGASVRCTFDGSVPDKNTPVFSSSQFLEKSTVVRCGAFKDGLLTKTIVTNTFFISETVSMPVLSIAVDPYDMFDSANGYYSQGIASCAEPCYDANYFKDIELPVHVEFFESANVGTPRAWNINAGLSIMGGWSRYNDKKSVSISMREQYQDGRLEYPLFETRPDAKKFKAFNLRNNGNRFHWDFVEDAMGGALLEGSGVDYQRSRQVIVFYNGEYFGIHDLRERLNEHFVETNYGIDASTVESIKHTNRLVTANGGTIDGYVAMLDFVDASDFSEAGSTAYQTIQAMLDVGSYADYMAAQIFYRNGDWPNNNVRAWRSAPEHPWKFMVFDLDHGFNFEWTVPGFGTWINMFDWIKEGGGGESSCLNKGCFAQIFNKLILNPDFKRLFINRSAVMLKNYLTSARIDSITDAMVSKIPEAEMDRDIERWPRKNSVSYTGSALKSFGAERETSAWEEYRSEFDLSSDVTIAIQSTGSGIVLMEGMTLPPRNATKTNYTGTFFGGIDMQLTAIPTQAGATFVKWEDGSTANPRLVTPTEGATYIATFK